MADTLLRVLSNADLDWIIARGKQQTLAVGQSLFHPYSAPDQIALIIEGSLGESFAADDAAVDKTVLIDELGAGEMVGFSPLLDKPSLTAVKALKSTLILSLPIEQIKAKLADDIAFAAHFYHAIALMLCDRLRRLFEQPEGAHWGDRPAGSSFDHRTSNDVLTVFGELRDSDVDWLTAFGQVETIAVGQVLLQAARPVESLYILLDGQMAMSVYPGRFDPLALCFLEAAASRRDRPTFTSLSPGSIPGIVSLIDWRPLPIAVQAVTESLIFAVPRQTLVTKLLVDNSFASRFYQVIAMQILEQLQTAGMGFMSSSAMAAAMDDELDMDDLQQVSEGAKKFGWMLNQLGVNHHG